MKTLSLTPDRARRTVARSGVWIACTLALVLTLAAATSVQAAQRGAKADAGTVTATLEQCGTSVAQAERSATFAGEMTAIAGTAKMAMRIDLEERMPGELEYHTVSAAGLGAWRAADPKVKVYKYLKQVTNLSAPASYRGYVRFRWLNAKGHVIKRAERFTTRCLQPPPPVEPPGPATPASEAATPAAAPAAPFA
ncbi:MAG TPA: hypothetical protein VK605_04630 [Solirubrobacteraceae bacterium]|nr:hypothetical protein [Solirubrobacteraceae bacterium]